ncbi:MAG: hypothetical protein ABIH25_02590 [Candidatus Woesearchaeota archaeon]
MNNWLIFILSITSLLVIYWVLFGERKFRRSGMKARFSREQMKLVGDILLLPDNKFHDLCVKKLKLQHIKINHPPYPKKEKQKLTLAILGSYPTDVISKALNELNKPYKRK